MTNPDKPMSNKSDLEYLLEAWQQMLHNNETEADDWVLCLLRMAIRRRKQDLAKEVMQDAGRPPPQSTSGADHG